jgi:phage gp29-like protein
MIQLGIASMFPPRMMASEATAARNYRFDAKEYGATGTPIFGGGFQRDIGEYNSHFEGGPFSSFRIYEKMRRGDAQVAATLSATKLAILCAEWSVIPPKNPTPIEREAAQFVERCLFDEIDFNGVIENALLMLDFGVAAHEDIWEPVNGRLQWKKLAARLPLTFYEWMIEPDSEDLAALVQMGYKGQQYTRFVVPADKLAIFTLRREGNNFAGRAMLREMYQHWYTKSKLYVVDGIAHERNGMGVPTITMGPDAKKEDRLAALKWASTLSAGEATGLVLPPAWQFALEALKGTVRDPMESIIHHNNMISMAGLAMFMQLGQTKSGSRALGDSMSDFFYMGLQGTADQIGLQISQTSIKRLTSMNFGDDVRPPALIPQQLLALKFEAITNALALMGRGGIMTPTPDLEAWLRKKMGAPEADAAAITRARSKTITAGKGKQPPTNPGSDSPLGLGEIYIVGAEPKPSLRLGEIRVSKI